MVTRDSYPMNFPPVIQNKTEGAKPSVADFRDALFLLTSMSSATSSFRSAHL